VPAALEGRTAATALEAGLRCAVCQTAIVEAEDVGRCPACRAPYHLECWSENGGCAAYGCVHTPEPAPAADPGQGAPASVWGREDKPCPRCGQSIKVAARRCRHCGQLLAEGAEAGGVALPRSRPGGALPALLLLGGVLPFTAPLVLLAGAPWLWWRWRAVRRWPSGPRVIAVVGVVASAAVTLIGLAAVAVFHTAGAR
jgi:hypothetical protein